MQPIHHGQLVGIPLARHRIVGLQLEGGPVLLQGGLVVELEMGDEPERGMRFRQPRIELQRLAGRYLRLRERFADGSVVVVVGPQGQRVGQSGIGERVIRIVRDRLLEVSRRLPDAFAVAPVPEIPAAQVEVVRLHAGGRGLHAHELALQRLGDRAGDLVLDGEDALQLAVVGLRPEMESVLDVDQLRGDAQGVSLAAHRAFQERVHAQVGADLLHGRSRPAQREGRGAGGDAQAVDVRQRVDQLLGDPF
jgi:hypothetical protein